VEEYARKMEVEMNRDMALIVQEQVRNPLQKGVIQLEENKAVVESTDLRQGELCMETEFSFLEEYAPWDLFLEPHDWISEGERNYAVQCARAAKEKLGLEGVVQVEFCMSPSQKPDFVQIRELSKARPHSFDLNLEIPEGVPYIESEVCNDVAGELVLPAYVTVSQSGLCSILIPTGQSSFLGIGSGERLGERAEVFAEKSNLSGNQDFEDAKSITLHSRIMPGIAYPSFEKMWKRGNLLFEDYILVCDKLDETLTAMGDCTTGKKAIITCLEAKKTSHAMTVARDLGIMCLGFERGLAEEGSITDYTSFFNQVETGDLVHMKSDGKKAVAYIEKKREKNPYLR
jgi:hypothetical protein